MGENITQIKIGDDVHCISLDTLVIDTSTIGFGGDGKLGVRLGSSVYAAKDGIGVKIHPDTLNFLRREPSGLSLKLDTMANGMAEAMAGAVGKKLGLAIDSYNNLVMGTQPLKLGTGLKGGDNGHGHTLCLSLGSGLMFVPSENKIRVKLLVGQVLQFTSDGELSINYEALASILESNYGFVRNK